MKNKIYKLIYLEMWIESANVVLMCAVSANVGAYIGAVVPNVVPAYTVAIIIGATMCASYYALQHMKYTLAHKYDAVIDTCKMGCTNNHIIFDHCWHHMDSTCTCTIDYSCKCSWCRWRVPKSVLDKFPECDIKLCVVAKFAHTDCPICVCAKRYRYERRDFVRVK